MIEYYKRSLKDKKIRKKRKSERGCWINVTDPDEEEIDILEKRFNLDRQNIISGADKNEVPRVEFDDNRLYVFLKIKSPANSKELDTILIILTESVMITLSRIRPNFIDKIVEGKIELFTTQKLKSMLNIFSLINKEFEKLTLSIVRSVHSKKKDADELTEKDLKELLNQENTLNNLLSSYNYANLVYQRITKKVKFYEEDKEFLEDLSIEAKQGLDLCNSSLKTISNLRNHYEISLSSKLNKVITLLTIFTIFLSIPAAISGIYGMNLVLPLQENPDAFKYVASFIGVLWIGMIVYFKKRKII